MEAINRTLGLELEPGEVIFTGAAQAHAARSHPDDFRNCFPLVGAVINRPSYAGDDFRNPGKIELVARMGGEGGILVALCIERDDQGRYGVCSVYPIGDRKIENRRQKRHLHIVQWK